MKADAIWIAGMPRSGTTWLATIFASHPDVRLKLCPLFSYEMRGALDEHSDRAAWVSFAERAYATKSPYMDAEHRRADGLFPAFARRAERPSRLVIKSNRFHQLLPRGLAVGAPFRYVLVVRDPRDTIASWLSNPREFPEDADPAHEWRSGACRKTRDGEFWGFEDWRRVTEMYLDMADADPERTILFSYDDLTSAPELWTCRLFKAVGLDMDPQTEAFLIDSRARQDDDPRAIFKTRPGHMRDALPAGAAAAMERELAGTRLERFLATEAAA